MLTRIDEHWTQGTHIVFRNLGKQYTKRGIQKTNKYEVCTKDNTMLGTVTWFSRWRKYAFNPLAYTVYEETCMGEISQFIVEETKTHMAAVKQAKANAV